MGFWKKRKIMSPYMKHISAKNWTYALPQNGKAANATVVACLFAPETGTTYRLT